MGLLPAAVAAKLAAGVTVVSLTGAIYTATKPPPTDPVKRTQYEQRLYGKKEKNQWQRAKDGKYLSREIDVERANRSIPSEVRTAPRVGRLVRLLRKLR